MPHKIQKFALLIVLTITTILIVSAPAKVQAAKWHHITFQGKTYRSKYTIKQMRKKYHLKYRKTYHGHGVLRYSTTFNAFEGILHNAHTGHWESGRWQSGRKIKGYYAQFVSQPTGDGSIVDYSSLINLKTGHLYKSHNN